MLLDAAHLAIYQSLMGREALDGLDGFPLDRIIEMHVAGSSLLDVSGLQVWSDDHRPSVRPETWSIAQFIIERAQTLKLLSSNVSVILWTNAFRVFEDSSFTSIEDE